MGLLGWAGSQFPIFEDHISAWLSISAAKNQTKNAVQTSWEMLRLVVRVHEVFEVTMVGVS